MASKQYMNTLRLCPSCNTQLPNDAHFCGSCGHHLLAEGAHSALAQTVKTLPKPTLAYRRLALFSVGSLLATVIMTVSFLLELFGVLPRIGPSVPVACGGAVSDAFLGSLSSRWQWVNPSGNATKRVDPQGSLSLSAPPHSDIYPNQNNFSAPRLLQPINGDFTISTLVSYSPNMDYQGAGLLLWQDQTKFLRLEFAFDVSRESGIHFQQYDHGVFSSASTVQQHPTTASSIELRVDKQGDNFTAWWRVPDQNWQSAGVAAMHFDTLQVGLDLIADFSAPRTTASYDYFMVSCP